MRAEKASISEASFGILAMNYQNPDPERIV
jgi:hypothetical protein